MTRSNFALSPVERTDARGALSLLAGTGFTLVDAARALIANRRAVERVLVEVAVDRFLRTRLQRRAATFAWYEGRLHAFAARFGAEEMDQVTRAAFRAWLDAMPGGESSRAATVRAVRTMWSWARGSEPPLAIDDPTSGLRSSAPVSKESPDFLTVSEVRAILGAARDYRPAIAVALFAGVRSEELASSRKPRLRWGSVLLEERMVRIPPEVSKTGRARILQDLPETLWHWLGAPGEPGAPISRCRIAGIVRRVAPALGRAWPVNCLRHTFATYALALTSDPGRVSMWLGHEGSPTLLHRHYAGLTRRAEAESFFALRPE